MRSDRDKKRHCDGRTVREETDATNTRRVGRGERLRRVEAEERAAGRTRLSGARHTRRADADTAVFRLVASWSESVPSGLLSRGETVRFADLGVLTVRSYWLDAALFRDEVDEWRATLDDGFERARPGFEICTPRWPSRSDEGVVEPDATLTYPFGRPVTEDAADTVRFTAHWTERLPTGVRFAVGDRVSFEDIGTLTVTNVTMPHLLSAYTEPRVGIHLDDGVTRSHTPEERTAELWRRYWAEPRRRRPGPDRWRPVTPIAAPPRKGGAPEPRPGAPFVGGLDMGGETGHGPPP
jgi:hypothetical protein